MDKPTKIQRHCLSGVVILFTKNSWRERERELNIIHMISEARFTTIEDDINVPVITNDLKKWIREFRSTHGLPNKTKEEELRQLVAKEGALLLGQMGIGRKNVNIWVQDLGNNNGMWVEQPKKASYIQVSVDSIIKDPAYALSVLVHELVHGIQQYKKQSEKFNRAVRKTEDLTEDELFDYYTEPKELEAQLAQLGHILLSTFHKKKNKKAVVELLDTILRLPREQFRDTNWIFHSINSKLALEIFEKHYEFIRVISIPPPGVIEKLTGWQLSNKCWRQFKQKMFTLVESFKKQLVEHYSLNRLNNSMSKFDLIFEKAMTALREQEQRPNQDLELNIRTLVLKLQDPTNKYVGRDQTVEDITKRIIKNDNILDIGSDELNYLPKIRLHFSQSTDVDDFNVVATVLASTNNAITEKQKKFNGNESPESICDEVVAYLDKVKMEATSGAAAVKSLPGEQGGNAQPGSTGETALPVGAPPQPAAPPQQ